MEPVSLEDIKRHLVLDQDETGDDAYLASMITAARRSCELVINQAIQLRTRVLVFPDFLSCPLELPGGRVSSLVISYFDPAGQAQILAGAEWFADLSRIPVRVLSRSSWPATEARPDAVTISYSVGALDADELAVIRHAIRLLVGHWFNNREGVGSGTRETPLAVTWLLAPLRVMPGI